MKKYIPIATWLQAPLRWVDSWKLDSTRGLALVELDASWLNTCGDSHNTSHEDNVLASRWLKQWWIVTYTGNTTVTVIKPSGSLLMGIELAWQYYKVVQMQYWFYRRAPSPWSLSRNCCSRNWRPQIGRSHVHEPLSQSTGCLSQGMNWIPPWSQCWPWQ